MDKIRFVAGIDPGATTGLALYDRHTGTIESVRTLDFWSCVDKFREWDNCRIEVIIEAPVKTAMYGRQEKNVKNAGYGNRMMANAASNAREAELLADGLEKLGYKVTRVRPRRKKKGEITTKKTAEEVRAITGYEGSTNQHVRDAMMLVWEAENK